ncbi:MAG TPA: hypothetical protein VGK06_13955 [Methanosarcina sp.]|jgi:hypothetical protein
MFVGTRVFLEGASVIVEYRDQEEESIVAEIIAASSPRTKSTFCTGCSRYNGRISIKKWENCL